MSSSNHHSQPANLSSRGSAAAGNPGHRSAAAPGADSGQHSARLAYRTAESVSPGHPDKLCDQISDAILDAYLAADPLARVAAEVCGGHGQVFITGEITARVPAGAIDLPAIVHRLAGPEMQVRLNLVQQSPEIARGVDAGGAGDQGIMIGYATSETPEFLPREVVLSRRLNQHIYQHYPFDGKTQVTLKSSDDFRTFSVDSIVASFQNAPRAALERLVREFIAAQNLPGQPALHLNPGGDWQQGGFSADAGLTGRKLVVDNYGPRIPIGGGAFSGKDPSKVDRSAAYMARRIAVDYLRRLLAADAADSADTANVADAAALASAAPSGAHARLAAASGSIAPAPTKRPHEVLVRLAYALGHTDPLEHTVILDGQPESIPLSSQPDRSANSAGRISGYDLTPQGIIDYLDLRRPIYEPTARYGHFGAGFDWDS